MAETIERKTVVIIGGGLAGLQAAYDLKKDGITNVVVLEASFHIGGRCRVFGEKELNYFPRSHGNWMRIHRPAKCDKPLGTGSFLFEPGAEFVHGFGDQNRLSKLLDDNGFRTKHLFSWSQGDGGPSEKPAPDGGIGLYWLANEQKLLSWNTSDPDFKKLHEVLSELSSESEGVGVSLREWLKEKGVANRMLGLADAGYANTAGTTLDKASLLGLARSERHWDETDGHGDFRIHGSMAETVVKHLATDVDIRTAHRVTKIRTDKEQAIVTTSAGIEFIASVVIVAVPVTVLQKRLIEFQPPLPQFKWKSIDKIVCDPASKVICKFSKRPWPANLHGIICADSFIPEIWMDVQVEEGEEVYYCTAFSTSDNSVRVMSFPTEEIVRRVLAQLDDIFGEREGNGLASEVYSGSVIVDWGAVPYIWGGYSCSSLTENMEDRGIYAARHGRLVFAGEASHEHASNTAHGAMDTGARAVKHAKEILQGGGSLSRSRL